MVDCLRRIIKEEGVASLWNGVVPSLVLCCNPAIQFMSYEALKRYISRGKNNVQVMSLNKVLLMLEIVMKWLIHPQCGLKFN